MVSQSIAGGRHVALLPIPRSTATLGLASDVAASPNDCAFLPPVAATMNESGRTSTPPTTVRERLAAAARLGKSRRVKFALRTTVGLLVLIAVGRHVHQTWHRLHAHGVTLQFDPAWLALGVLL